MKADILAFVGSLAVGGTERHLSQVLPALAKRGWSINVVVLQGGGAFAVPIEAAGIPIDVLPSKYTVPIPKVRGALALMQQAAALTGRLRTDPPRLLHCFLPTCCTLGGFASRLAGFSPVFMSRRSEATWPSVFPGDKQLERWALRGADAVFGHSKRVMTQLASEGIAQDRLKLNHNGINLSAFHAGAAERSQTRRTERWRDDELIFASVANLIPYKGHVDLLHAFARLLTADVPRWRLVFIGQGDASFTEKLRRLAETLGIAERVDFLGLRSDIPSLLKAADVGVLASHHEGFPNAILEYMAAGLPVIATATGGNFDLVTDGETGLLVPTASPDAIANAAVSLLNDPSRRKQLGDAGAARVAFSFSLDACVDRYEKAYQSLLGKGAFNE